MIGLLLGCGLRRSEVVTLRLDQLQSRENHCVIVDLVGKGGRLRTVPIPTWCQNLINIWLHDAHMAEEKIFKRISNVFVTTLALN
jgi:integrase